MRAFFLLFLGWFFLSAPLALFSSNGAGTPWTLDALIAEARAASPTAELAQARLEAATAAARATRSGRYPEVSLQATYAQTNEPMSAFGMILNQGTFDNAIDFNRPGTLDALTARLEARYRLYTGGRQSSTEQQAEASTRAAQAAAEATLLALEGEITATYFQQRELLAATASLDAALDALTESLRVARLREEAGQLHPSERLNLEATLAERRQQHLGLTTATATTARRLGLLLGQPAAALTVTPDLDPSVEALTAPNGDRPSDSPQLRAADAQRAAAEAATQAARSGRLPTVEAFARVQHDEGWRRSGEGDSWTAGIGVHLPIFDGFKTRSEIQRALAERRIAEAQWDQANLAHQHAMAEAEAAHALALADLDAAKRRLEAAAASVEFSRQRFAANTLDSTALLATEARFTEAEMALSRARLQERARLAALHLTTGQSLLPFSSAR